MKEFSQTYKPAKDRSIVLLALGMLIIMGGSSFVAAFLMYVLSM